MNAVDMADQGMPDMAYLAKQAKNSFRKIYVANVSELGARDGEVARYRKA
jgi:hypothetical protein